MPTPCRGRASSFALRCTTRPGWGRARVRSAMRGCGSTSAPARGSTRSRSPAPITNARSISTGSLGLRQIVDSAETGYARFETAGGVTLSVQIDPDEKIVATTAIYLECDDLDERVEKLARSGIAFEHGPRNQPWMWREARLRDPDGNIIFFYKAGENRRFPPWRIQD